MPADSAIAAVAASIHGLIVIPPLPCVPTVLTL